MLWSGQPMRTLFDSQYYCHSGLCSWSVPLPEIGWRTMPALWLTVKSKDTTFAMILVIVNVPLGMKDMKGFCDIPSIPSPKITSNTGSH